MAVDGQCYVSAEYDQEGKRVHLFTTYAEYSGSRRRRGQCFLCSQEVPADHDVVIDFYVWHSGSLGDPETTQQEVHALLNQAGFPRPIRRIVVAVAGPGRGQGMGGMQHFTYRPPGWRV